MAKKGIGKIDPKVSYRILETQEAYVRNLYREKLRKKVKTTPSEEVRYLLELGIQMHWEGRREKVEMSHYFRAELRTFTENFFKENDGNYISRLVEINRYIRFIVLLLIESLSMLYKIYWMLRDQTPFEDHDPVEYKIRYFNKVEKQAKERSDEALEDIRKQMGRDGEVINSRMEMDRNPGMGS